MTREQLDAIRARVDNARYRHWLGDKEALLNNAMNDLLDLLAEVERLQLEASHYLANLGTAEILKAGWQRDTERLTRERDDAYRRGVQDAVVSVETACERWSQKAATRIRAELLEEWNGEDVTLREYVKSAFRRGVRVMREAAAQKVTSYNIVVVDPAGRAFPALESPLQTLADELRALPDPEDKS